MGNRDIVVKTMPNINSYLRFNRFIMTRTKRAIAFWIGPIIFFILGWAMIIAEEQIMGVMFIIISLLTIGLMFLLNMILAKRVMKSSKFYTDSGINIYTLNDEGIEYKTNNMSVFFKWDQVYRVYETNYSFYVMQDNMQSIIIDKRYISEDQSANIKALLELKLDKKHFKIKTNKYKAIQYSKETIPIEILQDAEKMASSEKNYEITVTTTLNLDSCIKFNNFHLFKGSNGMIVIFTPVIFLIISLLNYVDNDIIGAIVFIIAALLMIPLMMLLTLIIVKKNFKSNKFLASVTDVFFGFSNEGITQIATGCTSNFKWDQIYRVYETKNNFYLYVSKMQAQIILKSDFEEGGVEKVKELMNSNLTKKQNKLKLSKKM